MSRLKKILAPSASWAEIQTTVEINRMSRGRCTALTVYFNRGHFLSLYIMQFNQFPPWNIVFMAQAVVKNINGKFSGPATFFRGGGQCQCPPNKYYTFFHRKPVQVGASTAARIRVTGVAPSLPWEGAPPPLMGDTPSPPPLWSFAPPFPQASPYSYIITLYHFFQKSITLQFYVTLSWNFAGCKKSRGGGEGGEKGGSKGPPPPPPSFRIWMFM